MIHNTKYHLIKKNSYLLYEKVVLKVKFHD